MRLNFFAFFLWKLWVNVNKILKNQFKERLRCTFIIHSKYRNGRRLDTIYILLIESAVSLIISKLITIT